MCDTPETLDHLRREAEVLRARVAKLERSDAERQRVEEVVRKEHQRLLEQQRAETERVQTELESVREQLAAKTRLAAIGQMAASIAHKLRNPLGAVRNAAYLLRQYVARPETELAENLDIIDQEVSTADRIITNLMDMARSRAPAKERLDLGGTVREVLERTGRPEGIRFQMTLDPKTLMVSADSGQLRQVLVNLVTNAVHALKGTGEICIEARQETGCSEIIVRDNGPGVVAEHRERVFEALFSTKAKGSGLGLTICRQIIERHGGTVELLDEERPGAAFCVRLPR